MITADYAIIGAGFAGAATAYHLARRGAGKILLLEQESRPGFHSSGRNASMIRQVVGDPELAALARAGADFLRHPPPEWLRPIEFEQNGSLLLGSGEAWEALRHDADTARRLGTEIEIWPRKRAEERVSILRSAEFDGAVWCPTDGVVNIFSLLAGYLEAAASRGVRVVYESPVRGIEVARGRVQEILTADGPVKTGAVVNAAGPWAGTIAEMAGAARLRMRPCRRHLFVTAPLAEVDRRWPFTWDVAHDLYFRPESGGLLLCACDEDETVPGVPEIKADIEEILLQKLVRYFPGLPALAIDRGWAGLRTLSPDGRFVLGRDPVVENFFWAAGLGGHGVTASHSVGDLAARLILDPDQRSEAFSPARFAT